MSRFVLLIYGTLCSGKSTVIEVLKNKHPNVFHSSMDHIKWFISDYSSSKYAEKGSVNRILLSMNIAALEEGFSLIVEGSTGLILMREYYVNLSKKYNTFFLEVNLEAPYEVLLSRFKERIKLSEEKKIKISANTEEQMLIRYKNYYSHKLNNIPTIDSSIYTPEKARDQIEELLCSKK